MIKVHLVKKARKAQPEYGIERGSSYFWIKPKTKGKGQDKRYFPFHSPPTRSQLSQSEFWKQVYFLQEICSLPADVPGVIPALFDISKALQTLVSLQNTKLNRLPKSLQRGSVGRILVKRIAALSWALGQIETLNLSPASPGEQEEATKAQEIWSSIQDILAQLEKDCQGS